MIYEQSDLAETYAFCDPAGGKNAQQLKLQQGCRSAIVVVSADYLGRVFVREAWAERCSTNKLVDRLYAMHDRWTPRLFGVEANAMQSLFADMLRRDARKQEKKVHFIPVQQPTKIDKDFRVRTVIQPLVGYGQLFFLKTQVELLTEVTTFPQSANKDLIDALASAISLIPARRTKRRKAAEHSRKLKYLRDTGAPEWYISQVAEGIVRGGEDIV